MPTVFAPVRAPLVLAILSALLHSGGVAAIQQEATPVLEGLVEKGGAAVPDAIVVLHRVTAESAGEIDSVRVDTDGRFRLALPSVPDPVGRAEVYFASVRYDGVLYFGPPIHQAVQLDSLYTLEVYDTVAVSEGGSNLTVGVRYVVILPTEKGWEITDLFQIVNSGERTVVPGSGGEPVWSHPLPDGIQDATFGEGDLSPDATSISNGSLQVTAPVPPGERQLVARYFVEDLEFTLPVQGTIGQMELLIREPAPPLDVVGLTRAESVPMDPGVMYRRYTATDLPDSPIIVSLGDAPGEFPVREVAVALALVLTLAGLWTYLRGEHGRAVTRGTPLPEVGAASHDAGWRITAERSTRGQAPRRTLLMKVALIDQALENPHIGEDEAADLRWQRARLVRRLEDHG